MLVNCSLTSVVVYSLGLIFFELLTYFSTESERYKVLESLRKHVFPKEFTENYKDEVSLYMCTPNSIC